MPSSSNPILCRARDLPAGEARGFDPWNDGEDTVFIVRTGNTIKAYRNRCPHEARPLAWAKDKYLSGNGSHIVCFAHGAHFTLADGLCVHGPCLGQALEALAVSVSRSGDVVLENPPP